MDKALTIIIPSYNVSRYIDQLMNSLIEKQEIVDCLDIIIINDESKDDTLEKALHYSDQYPHSVRVIDKKNGGHGSGINVGVKAAKGKYLKLLDGDDWVNTVGLKELVDYIVEAKDTVDIIINPFEKVWKNGVRKTVDYEKIPPRKMVSYKEINMNKYTLPLHSITIRTELYKSKDIPEIDEKISYDDMEYILFPVPYIQRIVFLEKTLYQYRLGLQNQSMNPSQMLKKLPMHTQVIDKLCDYYQKNRGIFNHEQEEYYIQELVDTIATNYVLRIKSGMNNKESKDFIKKYIEFPLDKSKNRKFTLARKNSVIGNFVIRHKRT